MSPEILLRIKPKDLRHEEEENGWEIFVEGFATAGEAEQVGLKEAIGFFWTAIQGRYFARLLYLHSSALRRLRQNAIKGIDDIAIWDILGYKGNR